LWCRWGAVVDVVEAVFAPDSIWFTWDAWDSPWSWLTGAVVLALITHALVVGYRKSWALRPRQIPADPSEPEIRRRLTDSAGLATAWSSVYGVVYMIVGCAVALLIGHRVDEPEPWLWTAPILAFVLGLIFGAVAVHVIPARREHRMVARLARDPLLIRAATQPQRPTNTEGRPNGSDTSDVVVTFEDEVLQALERAGEHSGYLVELTEQPDQRYRLSVRGRRVATRVRTAITQKT